METSNTEILQNKAYLIENRGYKVKKQQKINWLILLRATFCLNFRIEVKIITLCYLFLPDCWFFFCLIILAFSEFFLF